MKIHFRSFIKIFGPPIMEAIKNLEKIAAKMPEVTTLDSITDPSIPSFIALDIGASSYRLNGSADRSYDVWSRRYANSRGVTLPRSKPEKVFDKSGANMGEQDFFFEWVKKPTLEDVKKLIQAIDESFIPLGCRYSITTKEQ
jgi:hypothetical protein